jgi:hypothetical protein
VGAVVVARGDVRRRWAAGLGWAPLVLSSCGFFAFHSDVPHIARDPDVEISVERIIWAKEVRPELEEAHGVRVEAEVATRPGAAWGTPALNAMGRRPCEGGVAARAEGTYTPSLPDAPTLSMLSFSGPAVARAALFGAADAALDVPVFPAERAQPGRCLRVPLQVLATGTEWRATPFLMGLELRYFFLTTPLPSYGSDGFLLALPLGVWLGRWRLVAAFEGGLVGQRGVAPSSPPSGIAPAVGLFGAAFEADQLLWTRRHLGLAAQLGYDLLGTVAPSAQSSPRQFAAYHESLLNGPRLALRALVVPGRPAWRGFEAPPDAFSFGLSAFVGAWWQSSASATPAPLVGFSLDGNIGF